MKTKEEKLEKLFNQITKLLNECCDECGEKQSIAQQLIIHSAVWGAQNGYEGVGILDISKQAYLDILKEELKDDLTCS